MSRLLFVVLLVVCLGTAVVGTAVSGLFVLTVVALAGLLVVGAFGMSLLSPRADDAHVEERWAEPTPISSRRRRPAGGDLSQRAA
ncbi:hypothetical protein [Geodermatophilus sp. SYSU D00710]